MVDFDGVKWTYYTKEEIIKNTDLESKKIINRNKHLKVIIDAFNKNLNKFSSKKGYHYKSNEVLSKLGHIEGYKFEKSKCDKDLIKLLAYDSGDYREKYSKLFCVDAINEEEKTILEVEAGRAYDNNQVLKDFFEACVSKMVDYLVIAVRNIYRERDDFEYVNKYFDVLYHSEFCNSIPLKGILIIGY